MCYYILLLGKRNSFYTTWIFLVLILGKSPQIIAVSTSRRHKLNEYHYRDIDSFDEVSKNDDSNQREWSVHQYPDGDKIIKKIVLEILLFKCIMM